MNKNDKKEKKEVKEEELPKANQMRRIIIETDGNNIRLVKAEVGGKIELIGILQALITYINRE